MNARWRPHTERPGPQPTVALIAVPELGEHGKPALLGDLYFWSADTNQWVSEASDEWLALRFDLFFWLPEEELLQALGSPTR